MKNHILSVFAVLYCFAASAQKVTAAVDRKDILIGEQFQLRLQANFSKGEELQWFEVDTISKFEILEKSAIDTSAMDEGFALSQTFILTSWDSGKLMLPSFELGTQWKTPPIPVNVAYSPHPFDTTQPYHEIKDILEVKKPVEITWHWYVIFALVIIGLFLLFFPKSKKKKTGEFVSDEGAYKKALRQLEKLRSTEVADAKLHYTEIIHIFREYLHRRKNIYSFSKTTDDISIRLQQLNMDREQYGELLQTMRLSDLVKFARLQPSSSENETSIDTIKQSIITIENLPHAV